MMRAAFLLPLLASAALFAACESDLAQLHLEVVTPLVPGPEFSSVEVELLEDTSITSTERVLFRSQVAAAFGQAFARGRRVASFAGLPKRAYVAHVRLRRPDGRLLVGRRVGFDLAGDLVLRVPLTPDCVGVACPAPLGSPSLNACVAGRCADERCVPPNPDFCGDIPFCNVPADCTGELAECAEWSCTEGLCVATSRERGCRAREWCDRERGCVPLPNDAGVEDASVPEDATLLEDAHIDASVAFDAAAEEDASTPVDMLVTDDATLSPDAGPACGALCALDDPCRLGAWSCDDHALPTCEPFALRAAGSPCGGGAVCDAFGECASCREGLRCQAGCVVGTVRCDTGEEVCDVGDATSMVSPGAACDTGAVCFGDEACGSGTTCSASGVCETCNGDGNACTTTSGCSTGTFRCEAGHVCVPSASRPRGTACAFVPEPGEPLFQGYCDGSDACVACDPTATCRAASGCATGRVLCSPGSYGVPLGTCGADSFATSFDAVDSPCPEGVCSGNGHCFSGPVVVKSFGTSDGRGCFILPDDRVGCLNWSATAHATEIRAGLPLSKSVSGDRLTGCAVSLDGELWCWASDTAEETAPALIELSEPAAAVQYIDARNFVPRRQIGCVLLESQQLMCWGSGDFNGLGDGIYRATPTAVPGLDDIVDFHISATTQYAVRASGTVMVWGSANYGVVGNGIRDNGRDGAYAQFVWTPIEGPTIPNYRRLARGSALTTCALDHDGGVFCWGDYPLGVGIFPYGVPRTVSPWRVPFEYDDIVDIMNHSAGALCTVRSSGELWCMGAAIARPELGEGAYWDTYTPPSPTSMPTPVAEASGDCVRLADGRVYCTGGSNIYSLPPASSGGD